MLGGKHYQKKFNKKEKKKEAKKERQHVDRSSRSMPPRATPLPPDSAVARSQNKSTLKGPVVSYAEVGAQRAARDAANDRKGVPFLNTKEAEAHRWSQSRGKRGRDASEADQLATKKSSLASSQAQRRRVLRKKGGEDLLSHFREQLNASTFRLLNEQLYNSPNSFAAQLLGDAVTFRDYHTGYRQQLVQWPVNPNDIIAVALLKDRRGRFHSDSALASGKANPNKKNSEKPKAEETNASSGSEGIPQNWVVADMGCGEAQVAAQLRPKGYTVHSFDLCALNEMVTVADSTAVPLDDASVDVCIFSLSLMATDYERSLFEAFRVLKPRRLLKIIEVRSRIPFPVRFAEMVSSIGFILEFQDVVGDYFVAFDFTKVDGRAAPNTSQLAHAPGDVLLPSMYKKR